MAEVEWRYSTGGVGGTPWQPYSVKGGPIERLLVAMGDATHVLEMVGPMTKPDAPGSRTTCYFRLART